MSRPLRSHRVHGGGSRLPKAPGDTPANFIIVVARLNSNYTVVA